MSEENDQAGSSDTNDKSDDNGDLPSENDGREEFSPPTSQVRIAAVEAAVAAGLAPSTSRVEEPASSSEDVDEVAEPSVVELPAWTEAPTGQVPRVLLDEDADLDDLTYTTRGPSWREDSTDWQEEVDLSIFAPDPLSDEPSSEIAGQQDDVDDDVHPYSFGDLGLGDGSANVSSDDDVADDEAWLAVLGDGADESDTYGLSSFSLSHSKRAHHRRGRKSPRVSASTSQPKGATTKEKSDDDTPVKDAAIATLTGLGIAAVAIVCFLLGAVASLVLAIIVLTIGAGEMFAVLRRVGFRPATAPGLALVAALPIGTYFRGASALPLLLAIGFIVIGCFYLSGRGVNRPVINMGATFGSVVWIGVLGSFAGLLLAPSEHPHRHGVALLVGAIAITVAHDVGSYVTGSKLGRHVLAPKVSPNKTIEGVIGGSVLALAVAALIVSHLHPFGLALALELGVGVAIVAPLGDLVESLFKRDLDVKDMGHLLPGHGGILDRIDAMLFVLPLTFYLASVHHLV